MPYRANYPRTVREVLNRNRKYHPAAMVAVRALRQSKAWRGSDGERVLKFRVCLRALAQAYGVACPRLVYSPGMADHYSRATNTIVLGTLSVVTLLHEFGHARGFDERQTCGWSINLFRRVFPRSFERCRQVRHTLKKRR